MTAGLGETFVPLTLRRRGVRRLVQPKAEARETHDSTLIEGMARAFHWQRLLDSGAMPSGSAIARAEGLHHSVVNELLRLTLLAPDIVEMLMAGRQPRRMSLIWFQRNPLPVDWAAQREIVRRFEEAA
ncbi:MAG TPA: site-specific recombinase resolvase [Nevskiales bacterium]|nr:site-specific recombinase resolvase [Nevskiales bacterium]